MRKGLWSTRCCASTNARSISLSISANMERPRRKRHAALLGSPTTADAANSSPGFAARCRLGLIAVSLLTLFATTWKSAASGFCDNKSLSRLRRRLSQHSARSGYRDGSSARRRGDSRQATTCSSFANSSGLCAWSIEPVRRRWSAGRCPWSRSAKTAVRSRLEGRNRRVA